MFNREYKTTVEQRTARDVDDRTKEGEIKTQVADETDVTLEALETQDISPQAEARRKRAEDFTERLIAEDADDFEVEEISLFLYNEDLR